MHISQHAITLVFMSKKIILLGYMGCGKSTIGAHIATSLSLPFQDLDVFIAEQEGKSIPEIFQEKGEIYFRRQEQENYKVSITKNP